MKSSKLGAVVGWIFALFCFFVLPIYGFSIGTILVVMVGICALPIKPIQDLWKKMPICKKWFKPICLVGLFVFSVCLIPAEDIKKVNEENQTTKVVTEDNVIEENNGILETTKPTESATETPTVEPTAEPTEELTPEPKVSKKTKVKLSDIPKYSGKAYITVNDNVPSFKDSELTTKSYEKYSDLDSLGRCGVVYACIGQDIMPTEERGSIGQVKPTGWHTVKYDCVEGKYLYNRCHLIGYQLTGENANEQNLITGTRAMNVDGMLPFENMVADYIHETNNHVLYKITPMYKGDNLLAHGVLMEAKSVEDDGEGILFNVFVYNAQDGVVIDYATGDSHLKNKVTSKPTKKPAKKKTKKETSTNKSSEQSAEKIIGNKNSKAYHCESCSRLPLEKNRVYFNSEAEANAAGYDNPCAYCNP